MPGSRVNLGMGQPGRKPAKARAAKKAKGTAVKKAKGGAMMEPPVGMKNGGGANARRRDHTTPVGPYNKGGEAKKKKPPKPPPSPGKGPGRFGPLSTQDVQSIVRSGPGKTTKPPTRPGGNPGRPPINPPTNPTGFVKRTRQGTAIIPDESGGRGRLNPPKKGSGMLRDGRRKKVVKRAGGGSADNSGLKEPSNKGLRKLPEEVRNKMGYKKNGGAMKKAKGGSVKPPKPKPRP